MKKKLQLNVIQLNLFCNLILWWNAIHRETDHKLILMQFIYLFISAGLKKWIKSRTEEFSGLLQYSTRGS